MSSGGCGDGVSGCGISGCVVRMMMIMLVVVVVVVVVMLVPSLQLHNLNNNSYSRQWRKFLRKKQITCLSLFFFFN